MATRLTRNQLAQFLPSHELIKAFESLDQQASTELPLQVAQAQVTANSALELATAEVLGVFDSTRANMQTATAQATANAALELATAQTLGVFEPRQQIISVRAGDGIQVVPDIAGFVVTVDLNFLINSVRAFLPRQPPPTAPLDDSQNILINKIFGR